MHFRTIYRSSSTYVAREGCPLREAAADGVLGPLAPAGDEAEHEREHCEVVARVEAELRAGTARNHRLDARQLLPAMHSTRL